MKIKPAVRRAKMLALDLLDVVTGRRPEMTPTRWQASQVGLGDFRAVGEHLAELLIGAAELRPDERVLDVGCGYGRAAAALTRYLTTGSYFGFDTSARAIRWCERNIQARYANFLFRHVNVYNGHYNPTARQRGEDFVFPSSDASFDVVLVASLFTHLTPPTAAQYVAEISRVLKPSGRAIMTFFLFDEDNRAQLSYSSPAFTVWPEHWWAVMDPNDQEAAIGFERSVVEQALRTRGLQTTLVSRGKWAWHEGLTYQDLIVARKVAPISAMAGA